MRADRQGFLLFELLLVFGLVSMIALFAFVQMRFLTRGYVRAEVEALYQMCLYAQRRAMSSGHVCTVTLDLAKHAYMCDEHTCELSKNVRFGILPHVKGPPSAPQESLTSTSTFKNNRINCSPEGTIDAGTVYLIDVEKKSLYALTSGVAPYSYVRTYRYAGNWQRLK